MFILRLLGEYTQGLVSRFNITAHTFLKVGFMLLSFNNKLKLNNVVSKVFRNDEIYKRARYNKERELTCSVRRFSNLSVFEVF